MEPFTDDELHQVGNKENDDFFFEEMDMRCELSDKFLDLKHIEKSTCKAANTKKEKTMLELIDECKSKNTTYETIINTLKNSIG